MMTQTSGKCLCGAVHFVLDKLPTQVGLCHCKMCRRWNGGLPLAGTEANVTLLTGDSLRWWQSSEWGERGFCGECGSSLFWRLLGNPAAAWEVSVGALDTDDDLQITEHIFIDDKSVFYDFTDGAPRKTGAQFTAQTLSGLAAQYGDSFLKDALEKSRRHFGDLFTDEVEQLIEQGSPRSGSVADG